MPLRRWLCSWLVLAVLFTQLATAAYVCPMVTAAAGQGADSSTDMTTMPCAAIMAGAAGVTLDADQPGLCMQHCQDGSQTFDPVNHASVPVPTLLPTLTVRVQEPARIDLTGWAAHQRSRDGAPPLPHSITHCCYRL